ncbi:hypothetical protein MLD38_023457 [Melastoma candidum]|uniref:Uncharacterized protein n=1 Tax=Melastoma candidum TaxID=119954 RepID=A0ACB9NQ88_9MYRT|nr:hypothetical protein MLD38_023457 [Melastoma candidum]
MLIKSGNEKKVSSENDATDDDLFILNDIVRENSMINIRKVAPMPLPLSKPGDMCFWRIAWSRNKTIAAMNISNIRNGDLIAAGSDGRGGRVKALRSPILLPIVCILDTF